MTVEASPPRFKKNNNHHHRRNHEVQHWQPELNLSTLQTSASYNEPLLITWRDIFNIQAF
jgi:hypothetical protein